MLNSTEKQQENSTNNQRNTDMNPDKRYILICALLDDDKLNAIKDKLWTKLSITPQNFTSDEWKLLAAIKNEILKRK